MLLSVSNLLETTEEDLRSCPGSTGRSTEMKCLVPIIESERLSTCR